jgi:hypothetical protein
LAAGAAVVEASFSDGRLRHLVHLEYAVPYRRKISRAAEREADRIAQAAAQEHERRRLAEQQAMQDAEPYGLVKAATMYPDMPEADRRERLSGRLFRREREAAEEAERNAPNVLARATGLDDPDRAKLERDLESV